MEQSTQQWYTSPSTQHYMYTPRCHTALLFMHESAWQGPKFTYLWVKTQAQKKTEGVRWLFPFFNLSFVSSFILFVLLFLYGGEDNLQIHKMPVTTNVSPTNHFFSSKNQCSPKWRKAIARERDTFLACIYLCVYIHVHMSMYTLIYLRVYTHTHIHITFQKSMSLFFVIASLYFNMHITYYIFNVYCIFNMCILYVSIYTHININKHIPRLHG